MLGPSFQNFWLSKTGGCPKPKVIPEGCPRRFWKERRGIKAKLWIAKLRANLWFASLTKQSFVWRQNSSPKAAKLLAEGGKTSFCKPYKAYTAGTKLTELIQSLQSWYKLCKLCKRVLPKTKFLDSLCFWKHSFNKDFTK